MLTKTQLPSMHDRHFGRVVNIGAIHELVASRFLRQQGTEKDGIGIGEVVAAGRHCRGCHGLLLEAFQGTSEPLIPVTPTGAGCHFNGIA